MRILHSDKSVQPEATKVRPEVQAAFDAELAKSSWMNHELTPDEASAVGLAVAREAERRSQSPWRDRIKAAGAPTPEEEAELAAAQAAAEPFTREVIRARINAEVADEWARQLLNDGYMDDSRDPSDARRISEAQAAARASDIALNRAVEDEARANKRVQRAQAAIYRGGQARQIQHVERGI